MFGKRRRERRDRYAVGFRPEWRALLSTRLHYWNRLTAGERSRLEALTLDLVAAKEWEASQDFEVTDEMRLIIAAQAALLILGLPDDSYRRIRSIIVHPTTLVMTGEHSDGGGIVSDDPRPVLGLADYDGPVVIAWDAVQDDVRLPGHGRNVVFHEFAHQLDMLDGTVDGTPSLIDQAQYDRWIEVCTRVFEDVEIGRGGYALDPYAGVNVAEFFAVATEAFFDDPHGLRADHADLYEVLRDFYRQDPARLH